MKAEVSTWHSVLCVIDDLVDGPAGAAIAGLHHADVAHPGPAVVGRKLVADGGYNTGLASLNIVNMNILALQVFVEPGHDVLQALHAVARQAGARELVRFAGEAHHYGRNLAVL